MRCLSVRLSVRIATSICGHFLFISLGNFSILLPTPANSPCVRADAQATHTHTHTQIPALCPGMYRLQRRTHTHTHMLRHINIFCCLLFKQSLSTNILVSCCCLLLFSVSPFFVLLLVTLLRSGHAPLPHICPTRATGRWCICQVFEKLSIRQREQLRCDVQAASLT